MKKGVDTAVSTAALVAVVGFFLWISIPVVQAGVSHADDAFMALIAKNIAMGKGYGYQISSDQFWLMDPGVVNSTGPALVLPIALLIRIFGPLDWLPGAATLAIFISQLFCAAVLLSRRYGRTPTCGFFFTMLLSLILVSSDNWFFGSFLGETVAFGFILIGMALLAEGKQDRVVIIAALCFSLAFVTKQISLFAVAGIVGVWLMVRFYRRDSTKMILRQLAIVILIGSSLPLLFEVWKLIALGWPGYKRNVITSFDITRGAAIGTGDQGVRLTTFLAVIRDSYISPFVILGLLLGSVAVLALIRIKQKQTYEGLRTFASFAWAGAAAHLAYILLVSTLWQRYFWIGIAVMLTAISSPLLAVGSKLRIGIMTAAVLVVVVFGLYQKPLLVRARDADLPAQRAYVIRVLDENPQLPFAADGYNSMNDVLYIRGDVGIWSLEDGLISRRPQNFIALINEAFTRGGNFYRSVKLSCQPLTPQGRLTACLCGERFWATYPSGNSNLGASDSPTGVQLWYYGAVDRRDCEVIGGWVMNPNKPSADITVELYIDNRLVQTQAARDPRPDLLNKGVGTGSYGFTFDIPFTYKDAMSHTAAVKVAGSDYSVPFLEGVFSGFECSPK